MVNQKPPLALLWDIDGTLLRGAKGAVTAWRLAAQAALGTTDLDWQALDTRGATDLYIATQICAGCKQPASAANQLMAEYIKELPDQLAADPGVVLDNVESLLTHVDQHPHYVNFLLTGNLRAAAHLKLTLNGLGQFLWEGAFGDSSLERNQIADLAKRLVMDRCGAPTPMLVIGDTPRDVAAARAIGAQVALVATGSYVLEDLAAYDPDFLLPCLPTPDVFSALVKNHFNVG
jgi:phosphoglycolate phosphatase-like HAD superfamily hydrolase